MRFKKLRPKHRAKPLKIAMTVSSIVLLASILTVVGFGSGASPKGSVPTFYYNQPNSLNWLTSLDSRTNDFFKPIMTGLIRERDKGLDNLSELRRKIQNFPVSSFREVKVGGRTFNLNNTADVRDILSSIEKYEGLQVANEQIIGTPALGAQTASGANGVSSFNDYSYSLADNLRIVLPNGFNDSDRGITNQNGETYIFKLRDGITWSDGTPITTNDFITRFNLLIDAHPSLFSSRQERVTGGLNLESNLEKLANKIIQDRNTNFDDSINEVNATGTMIGQLYTEENASIGEAAREIAEENVLNEITKYIPRLEFLTKQAKTLKTLFNTWDSIKNNGDILSDIQDTDTSAYTNTMNEITRKIDLLRSTITSGNLYQIDNIDDTLVFFKGNKDRYLSFSSEMENLREFSVNTINVLKEQRDSILNSIEDLKTDFHSLMNIRRNSILATQTSNTFLDSSPLAGIEKEAQEFRDELKISNPLVPIISQGSEVVIQKPWKTIAPSVINHQCSLATNLRSSTTLDSETMFKNGDKTESYNNIEEVCNDTTLFYARENNEIVLRLATALDRPRVLSLLSSSLFYPVQESSLRKIGSGNMYEGARRYTISENEVKFSGAFKFSGINSGGVSLNRNEMYWDSRNTILNNVRISFFGGAGQENIRNIAAARNSNGYILGRYEDQLLNEERSYHYENSGREATFLEQNLYSDFMTYSYFKRRIGETIVWGNGLENSVVYNYKINTIGTCEVQNSTLEFPEKTMDNYLCGVIPEYRNYTKAMKSLLISTMNLGEILVGTDHLNRHLAETITPTNISVDGTNEDYLDKVKNAIAIQNSARQNIEATSLATAFQFATQGGVSVTELTKNKKLNPQILNILNLEPKTENRAFTFNEGFWNANKVVQEGAVTRTSDNPTYLSGSYDLGYASLLWNNIRQSVPLSWYKDVVIKIGEMLSQRLDPITSSNSFQKNWFSIFNNITGSMTTISTGSSDKESNDYSVSRISPSAGNSLNSYIGYFNKNKDDNFGFSYDNIPNHMISYFIDNIETGITNSITINNTEKNRYLLIIQNLLSRVRTTENATNHLPLKDVLLGPYLNEAPVLKELLFAQIEAWYLREGFIIPLYQTTGSLRVNGSAEEKLPSNGWDLTYAYLCGDNTIENERTSYITNSKNVVQLPTCFDSNLIKRLNQELE